MSSEVVLDEVDFIKQADVNTESNCDCCIKLRSDIVNLSEIVRVCRAKESVAKFTSRCLITLLTDKGVPMGEIMESIPVMRKPELDVVE